MTEEDLKNIVFFSKLLKTDTEKLDKSLVHLLIEIKSKLNTIH